MKSYLRIALLLLICTSCTTPGGPMLEMYQPKGYIGPMAQMTDTFTNHAGSEAHFFVLQKIDEHNLQHSGESTRRANLGRGFRMTPSMVTRTVAAIEQTFTVAGFVHFATDAQTIFRDDRMVTAEIRFTPQIEARYRVVGTLDPAGPKVWIEDSAGAIVDTVVQASDRPR